MSIIAYIICIRSCMFVIPYKQTQTINGKTCLLQTRFRENVNEQNEHSYEGNDSTVSRLIFHDQ